MKNNEKQRKNKGMVSLVRIWKIIYVTRIPDVVSYEVQYLCKKNKQSLSKILGN